MLLKNQMVEICFSLKNGKSEERTIKTGLEGENTIEIIEGVEEGERVIIER